MSSRKRAMLPQKTEQQKRNEAIMIWGAIAAGVVILAVLLVVTLREPAPLEGLARIAGLLREHDDEITYPESDLPPAGGVHASEWQNCGLYDTPIELKNALHSLEHGAVWLTYQPELAAGDVERLQGIVREETDGYVLMSPFPGQRSPVVLTAWGIQLEVDSARDGRISEFIAKYQQGIQTPERGASCTDGVGEPLQ
ncbi:MAG: DUF3105 domain-containing protein [Chloroflexota bacterium]